MVVVVGTEDTVGEALTVEGRTATAEAAEEWRCQAAVMAAVRL